MLEVPSSQTAKVPGEAQPLFNTSNRAASLLNLQTLNRKCPKKSRIQILPSLTLHKSTNDAQPLALEKLSGKLNAHGKRNANTQ